MAHLNHVPGLHFPGVFRDSRNRFPVEGGKAEVRQSVCQEPGQLSVICSFVKRGVGALSPVSCWDVGDTLPQGDNQ